MIFYPGTEQGKINLYHYRTVVNQILDKDTDYQFAIENKALKIV